MIKSELCEVYDTSETYLTEMTLQTNPPHESLCINIFISFCFITSKKMHTTLSFFLLLLRPQKNTYNPMISRCLLTVRTLVVILKLSLVSKVYASPQFFTFSIHCSHSTIFALWSVEGRSFSTHARTAIS